MKILLLLFSYATAANVILNSGISTKDDMFTLVCSSKGNVLVWRNNGDEIAIFNGREMMGHTIVNTYNSTTIEFNATLLSISTDSSAIPVRISSIELNTYLYGCSEIQCETDLGRDSLRVTESDGCNMMGTTTPTTDSTNTASPRTTSILEIPTENSTRNESCTDLEALQDLRNEGRACSSNGLETFVLDLLSFISEYAMKNNEVKQKLQSISRHTSFTKHEEIEPSSGGSFNKSSKLFFIVVLFISEVFSHLHS